ncbi:hypothetical protein [Pseudomonas sp.]|uniref:hypothetical protein n=1 Tax=Pseudomonas sp. TaxID=306 RepID=UPI00290FD5BD|nr:hypothetical protein [Pseudomonas sp.]MDU4254558.1 hypothetical protein [Pseudomonas sp.]
MTKALDAIENRMRLISNTINVDDLAEHLADVDGYIDALRDFEHISEKEAGRLSREARALRDAMEEKLNKKARNRR